MKPYYEHGGVTIFNASCLDVADWLAADVLVTDPPYGMAYQSGWKDTSVVANDNDTLQRDAALKWWGGKPAIVFGRWSVPRPADTKMLLIWDKGDWPGMGDLAMPWGPSTEEIYVMGSGFSGKRSGQILRNAHRPSNNSLHPTEKPVGLMEALLAKCPAGTVADPFMGSGTTLVAAKNLGRRAIGVELNEKYCEIAAKRLSQEVLFGVR